VTNQPGPLLAKRQQPRRPGQPSDPKDLAEDIVENIEAGLNNFRTVLAALGK